MAQFYNKSNTLVKVTVDGWSSYDIESLTITGNDVSGNIFTGIHTSQLSLSVLTTDKNIYTGSLIGESVTVEIGDEVRIYTIVTNVGDMSANYALETVRIEAVDGLLMLKNEKYESKGYDTIENILGGILGGFVLCDGWGGTSALLSLEVNTATLWKNDNNTAPNKFEVLEAILKYINRALAYDYTLGKCVMYNARVLNQSVSCVIVASSGSGYAETTSTYQFKSKTLNSSAIASSDRSVTLSDSWQSAQIECEFNDVKVTHAGVSYDATTQDEGIITKNGKKYKYDCYFGEDEGSVVLPDGKTFDDLSIANIQQWVADGKKGACNVNLACQEIEDEDAEGVRRGSDYVMLFGANNGSSDPLVGDIPIALATKKYECDIMVTRNTPVYVVLSDSVTYSNLPIPDDVGSFTAYRPFVGVRIKLTWADGSITDVNGNPLSGAFAGDTYVGMMLDGADAVKSLGSSYSTIKNVMWNDHLQTDGFKVKIASNNVLMTSHQLKKVEVSLCPKLWYAENYYGTGVVAGKYEFHKLDVSVEVSASVDESVFDTSTIYKWENDLTNGVTINGNEYEGKPVFVTYDGKKAGNNCVISNNDYAGAMADECSYYGNACVSELRAVADLGVQYGRNVFSEVISVKGLQTPLSKWRDSYFAKNCVPVALTLDVVNDSSSITLMEVV